MAQICWDLSALREMSTEQEGSMRFPELQELFYPSQLDQIHTHTHWTGKELSVL